MMLRFASFIFLAATVVASPSREATTNRARLTENLPPLPPKFGRELPGYPRGGYEPHVHVGRSSPSSSPSPSPSHLPPPPPIAYAGRIEVRSANTNSTNSSLGFLENTAGGLNGVNLGGGEDLHVTFNATASGKGPFNILAKNPKFTGPAFLGGKSTNSSLILSANSGTKIDFSNVEQTPPRSRPVKGPDGNFEESSIWSIDHETKEIAPHWINPDGSPPPTKVAYNIGENVVFFTGNIDMYNYANHESAYLVELFLASD